MKMKKLILKFGDYEMKNSTLFRLSIVGGLLVLASGCLQNPSVVGSGPSNSASSGSSSTTSTSSAGITVSSSTSSGIPGVPGAAVPTANAVIARINVALAGNVSPQNGNFAQAIKQISIGLPQTSNPMAASGLDKIPLLGYAACSDVKLSSYGITGSPTATTVSASSAALVAAGVKMIDQITNGLGSAGPVSSQVQSTFTNLVAANASIPGETTQMAFISVCMAAVSFAASGMGF